MKLLIGPRGLTVRPDYSLNDTTEIISGGAKGVDTCEGLCPISHKITSTCLNNENTYSCSGEIYHNQNADLVCSGRKVLHGTKLALIVGEA